MTSPRRRPTRGPGSKDTTDDSILASRLCVSVDPGALGLAVLHDVPRARGQDSKGFHPLFNGKDLTGWVTPADKSLFTVEDGEIVGRTTRRSSRRTSSW